MVGFITVKNCRTERQKVFTPDSSHILVILIPNMSNLPPINDSTYQKIIEFNRKLTKGCETYLTTLDISEIESQTFTPSSSKPNFWRGLLSNKRFPGKSGSSIPWQVIVGVSITAVAAVTVINFFKYPISNTLGFTDYIYREIGNKKLNLEDYLSQGGDINIQDSKGLTLLHYAVDFENKEIAISLINNGANVNVKDNKGMTPLHLASSKNSLTGLLPTSCKTPPRRQIDRNQETKDTIGLLIAKGADVNAKNNQGETPLHGVKRTDIAELLIPKGAQVNAKNNSGMTPLDIAFKSQPDDMAELLISKGAKFSDNEINSRNKEGISPLHFAVKISRYQYGKDLTKWLIGKGADVNARAKDGKTPLHFAYRKEVAELLIAKGADVNAKGNDGNTPLHSANSTEMAELLIAKGADVNGIDNFFKFLKRN